MGERESGGEGRRKGGGGERRASTHTLPVPFRVRHRARGQRSAGATLVGKAAHRGGGVWGGDGREQSAYIQQNLVGTKEGTRQGA